MADRISSRTFWSARGGAVALEYALIVALIVVALIGALAALAASNDGMFNSIEDDIVTATENVRTR